MNKLFYITLIIITLTLLFFNSCKNATASQLNIDENLNNQLEQNLVLKVATYDAFQSNSNCSDVNIGTEVLNDNSTEDIKAKNESRPWSQTQTFTSIGSFSVHIEGPSTIYEIYDGPLGTWTADIDGGVSPYTYEWKGRITSCRSGYSCGPTGWFNIGGSAPNEGAYLFSDGDAAMEIKLTVTDDNDQTAIDYLFGITYHPDL